MLTDETDDLPTTGTDARPSFIGEIAVPGFDEPYLFLSSPSLDLLFSFNRVKDVLITFEPN